MTGPYFRCDFYVCAQTIEDAGRIRLTGDGISRRAATVQTALPDARRTSRLSSLLAENAHPVKRQI
jgi:hypothetical protein